MVDLTDKVAIVTGSSRGIGEGCAVEMARCGANIVVNYFNHQDDAERVSRRIHELGREAAIVQADVSQRDAVDRLVSTAIERFGHLDIVVCNAYYSKRMPFLELTTDAMERTLAVCVGGSFHTAQAGARQMVDQGHGGSILFISSVLAHIPFPTSVPYNTSKAGVNHMSATIAAELAPHRIRSNVIEPGWTDTPGERQFTSEAQILEEGKKLPWGRLGTIQDIGHAAAFLCSDAADYITGSVLRVDGGFSAQRG